VDVETVEALEELLISADIGVAATNRIIAAVQAQSRNGASLRDLVKQEILRVFAAVDLAIAVAARPQVTLIVGGERDRQDDDRRQARQSAQEPGRSGR